MDEPNYLGLAVSQFSRFLMYETYSGNFQTSFRDKRILSGYYQRLTKSQWEKKFTNLNNCHEIISKENDKDG